MKLFGSINSPYVRKVRVVIAELTLDDRITFEVTDARDLTNDLAEHNPLRKVPTFMMDDGSPLYDSRVICEWLADKYDPDSKILPIGNARWPVLTRQALADGMLDAAVLVRLEMLRPDNLQSQDWIQTQMSKVDRAIAQIASQNSWREATVDLSQIAIACALQWLQFRLPDYTWYERHPDLLQWCEDFAERDSMRVTRPVAG
jgi:glutathione S-transferase